MFSRFFGLLLFIGAVPACATLDASNPLAEKKSCTSVSEQDSALDLSAVLQQTKVPSVSFARIVDGCIAAVQVAGERSLGEPTTISTFYNVASLTKPVTAEVALRLISEGAFSLDESMAPYWVDPDVVDDPRYLKLTPRLSLSHQTGFPNWRDPEHGLTFERDPGSGPGYSGEGYEYLAKFIEKRTGVGFEAQAKRLVFDPIGMSNTAYTRMPGSAGVVASSRDMKGDWSPPFFRQQALASDDLLTTAEDYARFVVAVMSDQKLTSEISVERSRVQADRLTGTCATLPAELCPDQAGFALGWEVFVLHGKRYFMHTGSDDGAFAFAYFAPDNKSGVVILTNSNQGFLVILPILEQIGADRDFVDLLRAMSKQ